MMSVTSNYPDVNVPVFSNITVFTFRILAMVSALLRRIPNEAARLVPTIMAVGAARPRAQGQATTSVEMPKSKAN